MSFVNFSTKEITSKIVYYGPGLCGKTTTLQYIYDSIVPENKGQIVSLATDVDRTIYFDFLPLKLGKIQNFSVRIQLYTVPGQVRYNSTRKLVLSGTDGVVFVADSQRELLEENVQSHKNLIENLRELGLTLGSIPHILQYNKRDLPNIATVEALNRSLNPDRAPGFETCATTGEGVLEGLKAISKLVMQDLSRKGVINKRRAAPRERSTRTDVVLRPMVGGGALAGLHTVVEEYDDPFFKKAAEELDEPPAVNIGGPVAPPAPAGTLPGEEPFDLDGAARRRALSHTLSFSEIFDDPELGNRLLALEERVHAGEVAAIQKMAREFFYTLIEDERHFPPDMTESSRISMLGLSLRKYAHFYRLLSQPALNPQESLFLLHFLVDVHFGKGMP
jgi:hypothetical protein